MSKQEVDLTPRVVIVATWGGGGSWGVASHGHDHQREQSILRTCAKLVAVCKALAPDSGHPASFARFERHLLAEGLRNGMPEL